VLWIGNGQVAAPDDVKDLDALAADRVAANPTTTADVRLRDPCFYIFTSGTTGLPKASVMSHYRWYRSAVSMGRLALRLSPEDVLYCCLPFYHNNALTLAFGAALVCGSTLAIGAKFSASRFWDEVRRYDATAFCYIGELLRYLLNQPPSAKDREHRVSAIIGNGLRPDIWDAFKSRFGIGRIHEFYAASEGTNGFINVLNFDRTCGFSPTGWALVAYDVDADAPVRDARGRCRRLGRGATGLLLTEVSEKMPFDGYTRREDGEKKLMRDVFRRGDCWFNTGDLMRSQGWGHVQFVDRVGDTFRWQGENVATTEVEAVATAWPQIEDAVVYGVAVPGRDGRCGMLSASLRDGEALDAAGFAAHLRAQLPKYAVPRFLRLRIRQELTGTFKHQKAQLKRQGYDPLACSEPVWVLALDDPAWRPLTSGLKQDIDTGHVRL
jgi:acyl-CoA synthetase (AMP-forming)/AMP-acid ligase II